MDDPAINENVLSTSKEDQSLGGGGYPTHAKRLD